MADPIAHRVASRYLQALGQQDPGVLTQKLEATVHRSEVLLQVATQQHKFWASAIGEGRPFHDVEHLFHKIGGFLKGYQHEITAAMAALDELEHIEEQDREEYMRTAGRTADSLPIHKAAEADEALGTAFRSLLSLKLGFDRMEEIPKDYHAIYAEIGKALDGIGEARRYTTQVRMLARRMAGG